MKSATGELQYAIVQTLLNDADVRAIIDNRVFDSVPADAKFPYVSIGATSTTTTSYDCFEIDEITIQLDAWSRERGFKEVKELSSAVRHALIKNDLTLENNELISIKHELTREIRDPDGLTSHGIIQFEANIQRS